MYRLMVSLAEGIPPDDSPINQNDPPALFSRTENIDNYKNITDMRLQTEKAEKEDYIRGFEWGNKDDMLMIGSIGLEVVQEEERRLQRTESGVFGYLMCRPNDVLPLAGEEGNTMHG